MGHIVEMVDAGKAHVDRTMNVRGSVTNLSGELTFRIFRASCVITGRLMERLEAHVFRSLLEAKKKVGGYLTREITL